MDKPEVFTAEEIASMRQGLGAYRVPGAYEPDRWMVSKYSRNPEIVGEFPKSVRLRDITLRTMDQMPGVAPDPEDRDRLLRAIAETGVPSIEPSAFRRGHEKQMSHEADIIHRANPNCELVCGGVISEEEIELARDAGYDAVEIWSTYLGVVAPSCAGAVYRRAWQGRDWRDLRFPRRPEDQVERSVRFIELGKKHGVRVLGSVNLLSLCDESYVALYCASVAEAGSDEITLADGAGGMAPEAFAHMVTVARQAAPACTIGIHAHNTFGLGMSCAVEGVKAGATLIEVAVNEYEEHAGQPDLAVAAVAFEALYGVKTGVDFARLVPLARLAEEITGYPVQWNHPITGRSVFNSSAGDEYGQERHVDSLIHAALTPEAVGGSREDGIGPMTGPLNMWDKLVELGFSVRSKAMVEEVLQDCKDQLRTTRKALTNTDIAVIASKVERAMGGE